MSEQTVKRRQKGARRRKLYSDLVNMHGPIPIKDLVKTNIPEALNECLARAVAGMRVAAAETDQIPTDEFWESQWDHGVKIQVPHKWYRLEVACRNEVATLATMMAKMGIAERFVAVEEAKAALVIQAVRQAAIDAGIPQEQVAVLGQELRKQLEKVND